MPYFFKNSDALLVTLRDEPIFSKTLPGRVMSFMNSQKPILTNAGGETEFVVKDSQAGLFCKPGDPLALAELFLQLHALSEDARLQLGLNAKTYFESHFSRQLVYSRLGI